MVQSLHNSFVYFSDYNPDGNKKYVGTANIYSFY